MGGLWKRRTSIPMPRTSKNGTAATKEGDRNSIPLVVDGNTYDITSFLKFHPGGENVITDHLNHGRDAGGVMRGLIGDAPHSHSENAFKMLEQFRVSKLTTVTENRSTPNCASHNEFEVDLDKPLVFQVGHLGKGYSDWVHNPIMCDKSPRFFENDLAEFFTKTRWWIIPLVWFPVVIWAELHALQEGLPASLLIPSAFIGCVVWTLAEYCIHRFLFHMKTASYWMNTVHYLIHGFHHKHPMDSYRLVFPPAFALVFSFLLWHLMRIFFPNGMRQSVCGGGLSAYIIYDLTHYFLHYGSPFTRRLRHLKRYHLHHHLSGHAGHSNGFGITSTFWDVVFGTTPHNLH